MLRCFCVVSVCETGPVLNQHWTMFHADRGVFMPLCTTSSSKVKYFYKKTHIYYLIVGIVQLHYLKFEKNILT